MSLDSGRSGVLCVCVFLVGSCVLFTRYANMEKHKSNFKTAFHNTIYTFKNYFATMFSVFSNNKFNPNKPLPGKKLTFEGLNKGKSTFAKT